MGWFVLADSLALAWIAKGDGPVPPWPGFLAALALFLLAGIAGAALGIVYRGRPASLAGRDRIGAESFALLFAVAGATLLASLAGEALSRSWWALRDGAFPDDRGGFRDGLVIGGGLLAVADFVVAWVLGRVALGPPDAGERLAGVRKLRAGAAPLLGAVLLAWFLVGTPAGALVLAAYATPGPGLPNEPWMGVAALLAGLALSLGLAWLVSVSDPAALRRWFYPLVRSPLRSGRVRALRLLAEVLAALAALTFGLSQVLR